MPKIKQSLRGKIFLRLTILVGITLVATGTFSVSLARSVVRQGAISSLYSLVKDRGDDIAATIDHHRSITRLMAMEGDIVGFLERKTQPNSARLHIIRQKDSIVELKDVSILDIEGTIVISTDSRLEDEQFSQLDSFIRGAQGTYVGALNILDAPRTYTISTPIQGSNGILLGVLIAEYGLDSLYDLLVGANRIGHSGEFILLEPEIKGGFCSNPKQIVFSQDGALMQEARFARQRNSKAEMAGKNLQQSLISGVGLPPAQGRTSLLCSLAAGGKEGIIFTKDINQNNIIAANIYLQSIGLGIIAKVDEGEVHAPIRLLVTVLTGATCILILLVLFVSMRLSHDIVDPIYRLKRSLKNLNTGHWNHNRTIHTGDELEMLDKEVERLALRLNEAYTSLEEKVYSRTQELAEQHSKDEALLESIGEGVLAIDMNGKILTSNRSTETMLGWQREEILGSHFSAVLHLRTKNNSMIAQNAHYVQRSIDEKSTVHTEASDTYYCERKDGSTFPISLSSVPFLIGLEMKGVVVTFRDITEEKRIDLMKSEFISLASHQLRTPLTAIGWYTELLQKEAQELPSDQKEYIDQIIESHRRMVDLVNSLLNVSRIELGRLTIEPSKATIKEVVDATVKEMKPQIKKKNIAYHQDIPEDIQVFIDVNLVRTVLENLLSNAVKYTPTGGALKLTVISDGKELRFSVRDSGMGIPRHQQMRIFEKLFRADNVLKTDTEGTGIGLYISKYAAEAWGGRLWFESKGEKQGATFHFTVPVTMKRAEKPTEGTASDFSSLH